MSELREYAGVLVVKRCWCGIQHAIPESLAMEQKRHHDAHVKFGLYCPLGHKYVLSGESETSKLERNLVRERSAHDQTKAELRETEARRRAEKAAKTRLRNRVARGVCPCCKRTFDNLARHISSKHPEMLDDDKGAKA